jgi:hypothetical protein
LKREAVRLEIMRIGRGASERLYSRLLQHKGTKKEVPKGIEERRTAKERKGIVDVAAGDGWKWKGLSKKDGKTWEIACCSKGKCDSRSGTGSWLRSSREDILRIIIGGCLVLSASQRSLVVEVILSSATTARKASCRE